MTKKIVVLVAFLAFLALWLQREEPRGTFAVIESHFVAWLTANVAPPPPIPPLTLVLYDEEASELSGQSRMTMLDAALFTRAASRLGAVAAGVEGLEGNPSRMMEAAGEMPVFGGYDAGRPPSLGWTAWSGTISSHWLELSGLIGAASKNFPRGFVTPSLPHAGPREIPLMAYHTGHPIPSMLALAWAASQRWQDQELIVKGNGVSGPTGLLPLGRDGRICFWPSSVVAKMTMNELLVAAEEFERAGGNSPLRGHVVVLSSATTDVLRVSRESGAPTLPSELWAQAWESLRAGQLFIPAGGWFFPALWLVACFLGLAVTRASRQTTLFVGLLAIMVYGLAALGVYAEFKVLLPIAPAVILFSAAITAGRLMR